jgi:hypothetical protein
VSVPSSVCRALGLREWPEMPFCVHFGGSQLKGLPRPGVSAPRRPGSGAGRPLSRGRDLHGNPVLSTGQFAQVTRCGHELTVRARFHLGKCREQPGRESSQSTRELAPARPTVRTRGKRERTHTHCPLRALVARREPSPHARVSAARSRTSTQRECACASSPALT